MIVTNNDNKHLSIAETFAKQVSGVRYSNVSADKFFSGSLAAFGCTDFDVCIIHCSRIKFTVTSLNPTSPNSIQLEVLPISHLLIAPFHYRRVQ